MVELYYEVGAIRLVLGVVAGFCFGLFVFALVAGVFDLVWLALRYMAEEEAMAPLERPNDPIERLTLKLTPVIQKLIKRTNWVVFVAGNLVAFYVAVRLGMKVFIGIVS